MIVDITLIASSACRMNGDNWSLGPSGQYHNKVPHPITGPWRMGRSGELTVYYVSKEP